MANAKSTAGSTPATKMSETDRMIGALKSILNMSDPEAQTKRLAEFREAIVAAREMTDRFNKSLDLMRDFRGADFAPGVERIVLRQTNSANKAGRPKLTEAEKLSKLLG